MRFRKIALLLPLTCAIVAHAQTTRAQLSGSVLDQSGAFVANAKVRVTNVATGVSQSGAANEQGLYRILNLDPGEYELEVTNAGFRRFTQKGIQMRVGEIVTIDVAMQVGQVTENVEVTAEPPLLQAETASLGEVVSGRALRELPLGLRDAFQLVMLTPGITRGHIFGYSTQSWERLQHRTSFKIAGGREFAQEVLMDGVPNGGVDFGAAAYVPPAAATSEFKVFTNNFSAEYGRTTGGVVDMVSKGGTNEYHGQLYEFHRNRPLDANNFFLNRSGVGRPPLRRHQFGANIGGPVPMTRAKENKTFFFFSYEGLRLGTPRSGLLNVPTELHRRGDFSQTATADGRPILVYDPASLRMNPNGQEVRVPFPGNLIPSNRFDRVATQASSLFPAPNLPGDAFTGARNYAFAGATITNVNNYNIRVDQNFGAKNRLFGRWSRVRQVRNDFQPFRAERDATKSDDRGMNIVISDNHNFTPTLVGDLTLSYSRHWTGEDCPSFGFDITSLGFNREMLRATQPCVPIFNVDGMAGIGRGARYRQPRETKALHTSLFKYMNKHAVKMGFQKRHYTFNFRRNLNVSGTYNFNRNFTQGPDPFQPNALAGFGFASFLLGTGASGETFIEQPLSIFRFYDAAYVQDDWKVTKNLTLNLGFRWELNRGAGERHNRLWAIDLYATNPLGREVGLPLRGLVSYRGQENSRYISDLDYNDWGPRVGFAWRAPRDIVVRGGFGIFYTPLLAINGLGTEGFERTTPWVPTLDGGKTPNHLLSNPFPDGFIFPTNNRDPLLNVGFGLSSDTMNDRTGYTQQWNLSIQKQLSNSTMFDIAYVGSKGTKLHFSQGFEENFLPNQFLDLGASLNALVANPFFGNPRFTSGPLAGRQVARRQLLRPYPQYTTVFRQYPAAASSSYHSLQVKAEKRAASGLLLLASYTFSKQIDDSSTMRSWLQQGSGIINPENRRLERAVSAYDTPHRLVASYVYDLPIGRGKKVGSKMSKAADAIIGGWTFSGIATLQSGRPIAITRTLFSSGRSAKVDNPTIDRWFDTTQFTIAPAFGQQSFGNVGRFLPDVRMDGENNFDFTLSKDFLLTERYKLNVRGEFFNAFNTPIFDFPVGAFTNRDFGRISNQRNGPRSIQLGAQFFW